MIEYEIDRLKLENRLLVSKLEAKSLCEVRQEWPSCYSNQGSEKLKIISYKSEIKKHERRIRDFKEQSKIEKEWRASLQTDKNWLIYIVCILFTLVTVMFLEKLI